MPWLLAWNFLKGIPWQIWAIIGVGIFCWWLYGQGYNTGRDELQEKIDKANTQAESQANEARLTVSECYARGEPWVWDREAGKCIKQQP